MASSRSGAWAGWIIFAGTMLLVLSVINIFQGLVALIDDERLVVDDSHLYLVDLTSWGWTLLISGVVLLATGLGLFLAQTWARIVAIVIVGLHAASQIAWLGAYPVWSLLMIAMDTVVIFSLTARWSQAAEGLEPEELPPYDEGRSAYLASPHAASHRVPSDRPS